MFNRNSKKHPVRYFHTWRKESKTLPKPTANGDRALRITFLGTGTSQGIPVIACACPVCNSLDYRDKRLRTSIHIQSEDLSIVIDSGPDFRQQMLAADIQALHAVVFTHEHKDHVAGLDDIRAFNFRQKMDMPIFATPRVVEHLKGEFPYIFVEQKYPGTPKIALNTISNLPFEVGHLKFQPIEVMHYKLPVLGFRIDNFTYITDANFISNEEKEKIKGTETLVLNALQIEPHVSHFNLEEAIALVEEVQPKQAYFTHISHRLGTHQETGLKLPQNIQLAYDGMVLEL